MSFTPSRVRLALVSAGLVTLAACGGGGSGGDAAPATTSVTVSPSLGKFSAGAKVTIKKLDGTVLGSGNTTAAGTAVINVGTYSGAMLVEVTGGTGVTYYDEKDGSTPNFGATDSLTAVAPSVTTALGVTPATHAAVEAIKAVNSGAVPSGLTTANINLANTRIATALGITDVLQPPALVDGSTGTTLDVADAKGKYALQLAALAKLAGTGKTALDVAKDLAKDLSDNKLDGRFDPTAIGGTGAAVPNSATSYNDTTVKTALETQLKAAATTFGTTETKDLVNSDPTVAGTVTADVSTVTAPPTGTDSSDIQKAKSFFAELRTTLNAYINAGKVGYLDTKAKQASDDIKEPLATNMDAILGRLLGLESGVDTFVAAKNPGEYPGITLVEEEDSADATKKVLRYHKGGNLYEAIYYAKGFTRCWTNSNILTSINKVVCVRAGSQSYNAAKDRMGLIRFEITPVDGAANTFDYTAKRINAKVIRDGSKNPTGLENGTEAIDDLNTTDAANPVYLPSGSGRLSYTKDSNKELASMTIDGSFPASESMCIQSKDTSVTKTSGGCATGYVGVVTTTGDKVKLTAARTAQGANIYRYALSGEVSGKKFPEGEQTVFAAILNSGSYLDQDESNGRNNAITKTMKLNASIQSRNTKFAGSVDADAVLKDLSGKNAPTKFTLNGSFSDVTPTTGAGEVLAGKLEVAISNWTSYNSTASESASNYVTGTVTFAGTIKNPNRPDMKLVLSTTGTGYEQSSATMNFSYGTVSITGSRASAGATFKATNQDGIVIAPDTTGTYDVLVSKNDKKLASIKEGFISYVDGVKESVR